MTRKPILSAVAPGAANPTFAPSAVTPYGVIDDAIRYTHDAAGRSTKLGPTPVVMSGSRLGTAG
ncbi:hypothetical protein LFL97_39695 (plasmid) [Burkholderia sp. JSH-S8]|uniref:hypothetical protein n=1 Tax=Burkholderia stagnalis TaxID=1503054 RepID=UPI000314DDCF|nr:hypothetical protein [Burkholderia stagnalis]WGS47292.1 hypothetical protein LFL97_39695 [Burkholderia sp. JSH-S8]